MSEEPATPRIEIFWNKVSGKPRRWFFRIRAANGQIVAVCAAGDGFSRKVDCEQTAAHLRGTLIDAEIVYV